MANELKPNASDSVVIQIAVEGYIVKVLHSGAEPEVHVFVSRKLFQEFVQSIL